MTAPFNERYIAVGVTDNSENTEVGVVVVAAGLGKFTMNEHAARKLADDILRNANYLWPEKDEEAEFMREQSEIHHGVKP